MKKFKKGDLVYIPFFQVGGVILNVARRLARIEVDEYTEITINVSLIELLTIENPINNEQTQYQQAAGII
jgi:hypothetical protein